MKKAKKNICSVLFLSIIISGCSAIRDLPSVLGINPTATSSRTPTRTPALTQTSTFTSTHTATATPIPMIDRDLSGIVLQLSDLPEDSQDLIGWSGPGCMSEVYKDYPEVQAGLVHGYAREYLSEDGDSFFISSILVYGDSQAATNPFATIAGELRGTIIDISAVGAEGIAKLDADPESGIFILTVVWRERETVLELIYLGMEEPILDDINSMVVAIRDRMHSPVLEENTPSHIPQEESGRIAFFMTGSVYVINPDRSGLTCIVRPQPASFSFSPDGKRIAIGWSYEERKKIQIINSDGTGLADLTAASGMGPKWSPDGSKIAYYDLDHSTINVIDPDGGNEKQIADYPAVFQWYQGGKKIGLVQSQSSSTWLISMNSDGSGSEVMTKLLPFPYETCCAWSPDGGKILYAHSTGYDNYPVKTYIYIMNSDGSGKRRLTEMVDQNHSPDWSLDGTRIVFTANYRGDLFLVDPDGGNLQRLTDGKVPNESPVWSPDGKKIAYYSGYYPSRNLFVMNSDGSEKTFLASIGETYLPYSPPVWVP